MTLDDVKRARDNYKNKLISSILICLAVAVVLALVFFASSRGYSSSVGFGFYLMIGGFIAAVAGLIIISFITRKQARAYRAAYKAYFVERNLAKIFSHIRYDHMRGIPREMLKATQMVNTGDVYQSNDLVMGKYKDVAFLQADVHIEEVRSDGKNTYYVTIFKGRFMIFEFPKKFNFRLEVAEKGFGANKIPFGKQKSSGRKFKKIELESSEFNKRFKTYSEDDFEAFYLLDPAFIHNITELANEHEGKMMLGFLDNMLLVGLKDGKDAFEPPSVFKKLDEKTEMEKVAKEVRPITNFVDKLKLDKKLFVQK